jgi:hypothetical protein
MKDRALSLVVFIWLSPLLVAQGAASPSHFVVLKQDTKVPLKLVNDLSSATASKGQKVQFTLVDDLVANDRVVASKGSEVDIQITHVGRARWNNTCTVIEDGWIQFGQPTIRLGLEAPIPLDEETKQVRASDDSRGFPWGLVLFAPVEAPIIAVLSIKGAAENVGHHPPSPSPPAGCPVKEFEMKQGAISDYYVKHDVKLLAERFALRQ